jgi:L-alanine-DL-glutamate epimerase-like enolase superfamily enzyme
MKLTLTFKAYQLSLKHSFTTSRYTVNVQNTVVVCISNSDVTGYGEATANPYYGSTVEKLSTSINRVASIIETVSNCHPTDLWPQLEAKLKDDYFALCAIDCAYWDFYAKLHKRTLRSFWTHGEVHLPITNYTIGIDSIEAMTSKIKEKPWPIYKIKLGTKEDVKIIEELRKVTGSIFRIDANCAWSVEETFQNAKQLKNLNVEFIEQPLKADDWDGMRILKRICVLPIFADESCQRLEDVEKCAQCFDGINLKLMKCGGLTPALEMIKRARKLNIMVMAGCMTESTIGISSLSQLASQLDYIDADGAMLLQNDIASGTTFENGSIIYSDQYGAGSKFLS